MLAIDPNHARAPQLLLDERFQPEVQTAPADVYLREAIHVLATAVEDSHRAARAARRQR